MEEKFVLTEEMVAKAKTYMPLRVKIELAKGIAQSSTKPMKTAAQNTPAMLPLPALFAEDTGMKTILVMNAFLGFYFDIEINVEDKSIFDIFDYYAGSHILNQLERLKVTAQKEKVFDIIADFKDFKKMVDTEIEKEVANNNDSLGRLSATMALLGTPENVKKMTDALSALVEKKEAKKVESK